MKQFEIDEIISLENLKKFIIFNYLSFKKEKNEIEKIKKIEKYRKKANVILRKIRRTQKKNSEEVYKRDEFERKTLEIVSNEEIKEGRKPEIAFIGEPYDIISYGNSIEDIRYIEVKGHLFNTNLIRLTKGEYNFAKEKGNKYWIYLITNVGVNENPKIIKIQNPIEKLNWAVMHIKRKKSKREYYYSYIPLNLVI
ncbi:MAG: DUF3883 domain-containing protein [Candidatus Methanomethylicaceae archaeon]